MKSLVFSTLVTLCLSAQAFCGLGFTLSYTEEVVNPGEVTYRFFATPDSPEMQLIGIGATPRDCSNSQVRHRFCKGTARKAALTLAGEKTKQISARTSLRLKGQMSRRLMAFTLTRTFKHH